VYLFLFMSNLVFAGDCSMGCGSSYLNNHDLMSEADCSAYVYAKKGTTTCYSKCESWYMKACISGVRKNKQAARRQRDRQLEREAEARENRLREIEELQMMQQQAEEMERNASIMNKLRDYAHTNFNLFFFGTLCVYFLLRQHGLFVGIYMSYVVATKGVDHATTMAEEVSTNADAFGCLFSLIANSIALLALYVYFT